MSSNLVEEEKIKTFKINFFIFLTFFLFLILILRLFYLQVIQYKSFTQRAQYSTSRISILVAPRGIVFDRNGKILATNKQSISLIAYPNKLKSKKEKEEVYKLLSRIIKGDLTKLRKTLFKLPKEAALPVRLQGNISVAEAIQVIEKQHLLQGINIQEEPVRFYPNSSLSAHALGYISQISESELEKRPERKIGDLVGKSGIEYLFDDLLRGKDGKTIVEVDRFGKPINPEYKHAIIHSDPVPGKNVYLTIDLDLQKATEEALQSTGTNSAAIAVNPNTGEVLAIASYPTFDPNIFTKHLSTYEWKNLLARKALLNRAILSYVPGSIWKPVTLLSALDAMVIYPHQKFKVTEGFYLGKTRFGDWTSKEDILSIEECLAWSRDTAFYQIARKLTPEQIKNWGVKLGAGRKTGIELPGEEKGIVPDTEWKKKNLGEPWYPGNTLHYSIGQSFLLITPTQAARIYSGIATGMTVPKLQLIKKIDNHKKNLSPPETFEINNSFISSAQQGLEACIDHGTGQASKLENVKVAGKTGSAEVPGAGKTHGWFAAYAPAKSPEIVVIVIAEKAGHGGTIAAPIARKILEGYFNLNKSSVLVKK